MDGKASKQASKQTNKQTHIHTHGTHKGNQMSLQRYEGETLNRDSHYSRELILQRKLEESRLYEPEWHAPWKLYKTISGHLGWVLCVDVDPSNEWFVTGSSDNMVKIWDLASGHLKLTLTGHVGHIRDIKISARHPYLFTVGEDKTVKCWDLEHNKVIRSYHGHLSGVYCCHLHPTIDLLFTGNMYFLVFVCLSVIKMQKKKKKKKLKKKKKKRWS